MKQIILLIGSVIYCTFLFAFEYQIIKSDRTCFFQGDYFYAYKVDSVKVLGTDSLFYPNVNLVRVSNCVKIDGSWFGKKILVKKNGDNIIYNYNNEQILIKTQTSLSQKWEMYQRNNGIKAIAEVTTYQKENFLGLVDSVKTITVNVYDTRNIYNQYISTFYLKISKQYGILQTQEFYSFPENFTSDSFILVGLSNPQVGAQNLLWKDVIDIQAGNEFHLLSYVSRNPNPLSGCQIVKTEIKYLERKETEKTVELKAMFVRQDSLDSSTNLKYYSDSIYKGVYTEFYPKYNPDFDLLPNVPIRDTTNIYQEMYSCVRMSNPTTKLRGFEMYGLVSDSCYQDMVTWDCFGGCGGCNPFTYYQKGLGDILRWGSIVYSKKGDTQWGSPLSITAIPKVKEDKSISVTYSSTNLSLLITAAPDNLPASVYLFDVSGKQVLHSILTDFQNSLLLHSVASGAYIYKIVSENHTSVVGRLLIRR